MLVMHHRNLFTNLPLQQRTGVWPPIPSAPEGCTLSRNFLFIAGEAIFSFLLRKPEVTKVPINLEEGFLK